MCFLKSLNFDFSDFPRAVHMEAKIDIPRSPGHCYQVTHPYLIRLDFSFLPYSSCETDHKLTFLCLDSLPGPSTQREAVSVLIFCFYSLFDLEKLYMATVLIKAVV